ncbi:ribonuclease H-like domain-containing protein [Linnemannia elongata]|nr:ribonuclease H-like domain-containing protein [Linnemannia elongata]
MEILKEDFEAKLPMLQKAISNCDFISMDTEMSGLSTPQNSHRHPDSLSTRYSKVSASANEFLVVQLGICCFTWSDQLGAYEARPFNFPCFPSNDDEAKSGERFFSSQSTSLEFLLKNHFDFNKWIRHGIPYLTRREEEDYIVKKTEKEKAFANSSQNDIPIDDRNRSFIESTIAKIKEWLASTDGLDNEELTISANNAFYRRLVHQIIRTEFKSELDSSSNAHERTMTLRRMTEEIKKQKEDAKIARPPKLNLRRVLDMISEAKKPLIGHNCFLDLMQITQQFLWDLPLELDDWKRALSLEWKTVIDTKHLATHPLIKQHLDNSGLDLVDKTVQRPPFSTPAAAPADPALISGSSNAKYHEAGYDAFITGQAYLPILEKRKREIMENPTLDFLSDQELQEYYNKLHVMRSDIPVLYLAGPDPEPEDRPYSYMLRNIHSSIQSSTLFHLFEQYNPYTFTWTDDNTAWFQISKFAPGPPGEESERLPYELKPLPLGRLGEEYVTPFHIGDDAKAVQGRNMGVVSEAANIEVVSWKQWYEEREERERQQREAERAQRESQGSQHQQFRKNPLKKPYRAPFTPPGMTTPFFRL